MGYSTDFDGEIKFSRELLVSELRIVKDVLEFDDTKSLANSIGFVCGEDDNTNCYIDLELNSDFTGIKWNGNEKTYHMVTTLNVVMIAIRQKIPNLAFAGRLAAQGEEHLDRWAIEVRDSVAKRVEVEKPHMTRCPCCHQWFETSSAEVRLPRRG